MIRVILSSATLLLVAPLFGTCSNVTTIVIDDVRLVDDQGSPSHGGTLELLTDRGWLPTCNTVLEASESTVICRQLGYDMSSISYTDFTNQTLSMTFLHFDIHCNGDEPELSQCSYTFQDEVENCSTTAVVTCTPCTQGSVQLRGGVVPVTGAVMYCTDGSWKRVCGLSWTYRDAFVLCRELGLPATRAIAFTRSTFGVRSPVLNDVFNCVGNESSLSSCSVCQDSQQQRQCCTDTTYIAGVYCTGEVVSDVCLDGEIRLTGGRDQHEGRVEICSNSLWLPVNAISIDIAVVVCRQLGYAGHPRADVFPPWYFDYGAGPALYSGQLYCNGTEQRLSDCSLQVPSTYGVQEVEVLGIRCQASISSTNCSNGDIRLVNGTTAHEGRVEICLDGIWGSVYRDCRWTLLNTAVTCRQLGYRSSSSYMTDATTSDFGPGNGPFHLTRGVNCDDVGGESTLADCPKYLVSDRNYCVNRSSSIGPGNDLGVRCDAGTPCNHGDVRLLTAEVYYKNHGKAQVCFDGVWADICYDHHYNATIEENLNRAFCQQFLEESKYKNISLTYPWRRYGVVNNMVAYDVLCDAQSSSIAEDCSYSPASIKCPTYEHPTYELLTVHCPEPANCTEGDLRLLGGNTTLEGRLEMCVDGSWGSVTSYAYSEYRISWTSPSAKVACRQLGLPWEWAISEYVGTFGSQVNAAVVVSDTIRCTGNERRLLDCPRADPKDYRYGYYFVDDPIGLICQGFSESPTTTECRQGDVRLMYGRRKTEGRVNICVDGRWAAPCGRLWSERATELTCRQLGFPTDGSRSIRSFPGQVYPYSYYYNTPGLLIDFDHSLLLVEVECEDGNETSDCSISHNAYYCNHESSVVVICQEKYAYDVHVEADPSEESYALGSEISLTCNVTNSQSDIDLPLMVEWYAINGGELDTRSPSLPTSNVSSVKVTLGHSSIADYFCRVHSVADDVQLAGVGRVTLKVEGLLQKSTSNSATRQNSISARDHDDVILEVEALDNNFLFDLTWYHNGSAIDLGGQFGLSNDNKTLTITDFASCNAGVYHAQYDKIFLHPYNQRCQNAVLSLLRHYPALKPVVFCVNVEYPCFNASSESSLSINYNLTLSGTDQNVSIYASGTVPNGDILRHSSILWYRNGQSFRDLDLPSVTSKRHYHNLTISASISELEITEFGRYSLVLMLNMSEYLQSISCEPERDLPDVYNFVNRRVISLAEAHVDIDRPGEEKPRTMLSAGAIVGIVVGVIVVLAAVVTIVIIIIIVSVKRANLNRESKAAMDKGSERHENEYIDLKEKCEM